MAFNHHSCNSKDIFIIRSLSDKVKNNHILRESIFLNNILIKTWAVTNLTCVKRADFFFN